MTALTPTERQIAHQVILDRWNPHRLAWKLANHLHLKPSAVERLLNREDFQAEVVQALYSKVPGRRVALKMKILNQIRVEVGDSRL